jgi:D-alanyl-D-alanine dipeptidase
MGLVELKHPHIDIELAYATTENFTGQILYKSADECTARLHEVAALAFYRAADLAAGLGLRLLVLDGYRPPSVQDKLWAIRPDPEFVTDPAIGSDHSRGTAIDLTLTNEAGEHFDMGTDFDAALVQSHHGRTDLNQSAQQNRALLLGVMNAAGFELNPFEWWHYSLPNSRLFPLIPK